MASPVDDLRAALDGVPGELERARERVAVGGVAGAAERERAGRVRAHELDQDALAGRRATRPVLVAGLDRAGERAMVPVVRHEQVEEPGAGDLDALDSLTEPVAQHVAQALRDGARRLAEHRREQHRGVRRVVAEVGARRALELRLGAGPIAGELRGAGGYRCAELRDRVGGHRP